MDKNEKLQVEQQQQQQQQSRAGAGKGDARKPPKIPQFKVSYCVSLQQNLFSRHHFKLIKPVSTHSEKCNFSPLKVVGR